MFPSRLVGTKAPGFTLPDGAGHPRALSDYLGNKHVVLVFFRGNW